jgi:hypothetical protein
MTTKRLRRVPTIVSLIALMIMLAGYCRPLRAQLGMATLSGTVTDSSGAAIPGAEVTLQSATEKANHRLTTDATGKYFIPAIVPGTYDLIVKANGFDTKTITGIILSSGQGSTLNVPLAVGKATTEVTVNEVAPLLQTTTATVGAEVDAKQFNDLPMLGRNFTTLIDILPGVVNIPSADAFYSQSGVNGGAVLPAIYGQRPRDTYYSIDEAPDMSVMANILGVLPPPEAIAEMKVDSGMSTGAFGWAAGANVNVVTKSGTNTFHGDVWEYVRNDDLNARSYFSPVVGPFKWNQFGGAIGGPIEIPHLISKNAGWYFFGYYEGVRLHKSANTTELVPTAAELEGNFSADPAIYNPFTTTTNADGTIASRTQFAGNQVPTGTTTACAPQPTCINPVALQLAQAFYPLPNLAAGVIPGANYFAPIVDTETSDQFSGRVDHQFSPKDSMYARFSWWSDPTAAPTPPSQNGSQFTSLGTARYYNLVGSETHIFNPTFLVTSKFSYYRYGTTSLSGGPNESATTGLNAVFTPWEGNNWVPTMSIPGYAGIGTYAGIEGPEGYYLWAEDIQTIKGRHSLGYGGGYTRTYLRTGHTAGEEDFTSQQTAYNGLGGDALASFLLGVPNDADRQGGSNPSGGFTSWLATCTWNSWNGYIQDTFRMTKKLTLNLGIRWDYIGPVTLTPGIGTIDWDTGGYVWDHKNPITGAGPNIRQGLVAPDYKGFQPRVGFAYQITPKTVFRSSFGIFDELYGSQQQNGQGPGGNWPYVFTQTVASENTAFPTASILTAFPGPPVATSTPVGCSQCGNTDYGTSRNPYIEEWTASVQQQLTPSMMFEADYFGSHGVKLEGQLLDDAGYVPGTTPLADRQTYPQYAPFIDNGYNGFMSWYDGLTAKIQKRYSHGFTFQVSYTYSHVIDNSDSLGNGGTFGQPDTNATRYNLPFFKGSAGFDMRHTLSFSYAWDIPGKTGNRIADFVVAHWQASGIVSADSGVPYFIYLSTDNENIGNPGWGRYTEFPNFLCNPDAGWKRSASEWFNTGCFSLPTYGTLGTGDRHGYYADHLLNWDSSFSKQFPISEHKGFEFRAEFYNFTNSSTFDPPGTLFGASNFGDVSTTTRQPGRNIQFALKFHF